MTTRADIIAEARKWVGTPFRHQGRDARGVDCAGLVIRVGNDLGIIDYDVTGYRPSADGFAFVDCFRLNMDEITRPSEALPGDVVIFNDAAYPCHCGIRTEKHGAQYMIHAYRPAKMVTEDPFAFDWPSRLRFAFRFRGIE